MRQSEDTKTLPDGSVFITHSACYFGDYVGQGTLGKANIRDLRSLGGDKWEEVDEQDWHRGAYNWEGDDLVEIDPDTNLVITTSSYNYHCGWVREAWDEGRKAIEGLEHYPVIDEMTLCEVEHEDEGDWSLISCSSPDRYNEEVTILCEFYDEGYEFIAYDIKTGTRTVSRQDRKQFYKKEAA